MTSQAASVVTGRRQDVGVGDPGVGLAIDPEHDACDQCIFCCQFISATFSGAPTPQLIPKVIECVPLLLDFQPRDKIIWKGHSPNALLCGQCCRIAAEGHQLLQLLVETRKSIKQVTSKLRVTINNSLSEGHSRHSAFVGNKTASTRLREELVNCLQFKIKTDLLQEDDVPEITSRNSITEATLVLVKHDEDEPQSFPDSPLPLEEDNHDQFDSRITPEASNAVDEGDITKEKTVDEDELKSRDTVVARKTRLKFGDIEVGLLMKLCHERSSELSDKHTDKAPIYEEMAKAIGKATSLRVTGDQCRRKLMKLKHKARYSGAGERSIAAEDGHSNQSGKHLIFRNEIKDEINGEVEERRRHSNDPEEHNSDPDYDPIYEFEQSLSAQDLSVLERTVTLPNGSFRLKLAKLQLVRILPKPNQNVLQHKPKRKRTSHNKFKVCELEDESSSKKRKRDPGRRKQYSCRYCTQKFPEQIQKVQHVAAEHPRDISSSNYQYSCRYCQQKFPEKSLKIQHVAAVHRQSEQYSCSVEGCSAEVFKSPLLLENHVRDVHGGALQYFCNIGTCRQGFLTESALKSHESIVHDESLRTFSCDACPLKFRTRALLSGHKRNRHLAKNFVCEICSVAFTRSGGLRDHQAKVHDKCRDKYTCAVCGAFYARIDGLNRHVRMEHPDTTAEKQPIVRYPCTFPGCKANFYSPALLRMHNIKHTGERNFQCDRCPSSFKYYQHLQDHLKRHDGGVPSVQCPHCPRSLASKKSLKAHIQVVHDPQIRVRCEKCGEGFPSTKNLGRHKLICGQGDPGALKSKSRKSSTASDNLEKMKNTNSRFYKPKLFS